MVLARGEGRDSVRAGVLEVTGGVDGRQGRVVPALRPHAEAARNQPPVWDQLQLKAPAILALLIHPLNLSVLLL